MHKSIITLLFFYFLFQIIPSQAQKLNWLLPLQKDWVYDNGFFKNEKGEKKVFSLKEKKIVNPDIIPRDKWQDSLSKIYNNVYAIGNAAYMVQKYGMTAVVNRNNDIILPYANDVSNVSFGEDSLIHLKSRHCDYSYDMQGKLIKFKAPYENPTVSSLYLSYQNNVLYDYEKRKVLSDTFQDLTLIYPLKKVFIAQKKSYAGIINDKNEIIVPFEYQELTYISDSAFIAKKYGEYALITLKQEILIPFSIAKLESRRGNVIIQEHPSGKYAAYNTKGKKLCEPIYKMVYGTDDGVLWGEKNYGEYIPMDKEGNILAFEAIEAVGFLDNDYFNTIAHYAKTKTGWGIQRKDGTWIVPPFSSKNDFISSGFIQIKKTDIEKFQLSEVKLCPTCSDENYWFNYDFKLLSPTPCRLSRFSNTKDTFWLNSNRKTGLITSAGKVIFPAEYDAIEFLNDGITLLNKSQKITLLDKKGQILSLKDSIINANSLDATTHFAYTKSGKGIQRNDGSWAFSPIPNQHYLYADQHFIYVDKKAYIDLKGRGVEECKDCPENYYIFDRNGKLLLKKPAKIEDYYQNDYFVVSSNGKSGLMNPKGEMMLPMIYDTIQFLDEKTWVVKKDDTFGVVVSSRKQEN